MKPSEIREALKYPALLNIIAVVSTLNRIYAWLPNPKLGLWGHFIALGIFTLGAIFGFFTQQEQPDSQRGFRCWQREWWHCSASGWAERVSYMLFGVGTLWLVWVLFEDWRNFPRE